MIKIENLVKTYGQVRALDGLSLEVQPGVIYGFLGPNGAGKTTTMRILTGLARPDRGRASILGKEIQGSSAEVRRTVGVLPEEPAFYPWLTPFEYLSRFVAPFYGLESRLAEQRANELLSRLELKKAAKRRIGGFSRGMRQRLGLAQALLHQPKVLLLDEPVSALDPAGRKEILDLIESLRGEVTVLVSTHILADVERICDVIGIINEGKMILQSEREALLSRYAQPGFEIEMEADPTDWVQGVRQMAGVMDVTVTNHTVRLRVQDTHAAQSAILSSLAVQGLPLRRFEVTHPSLEDIFLRLTENHQDPV